MPALQATLDVALAAQELLTTGVDVLNLTRSVPGALFDELNQVFMEVANGAADVAIALGPVTTGQVVVLFSDQALSFKVNGAAAGISTKILILSGCSVTALTVSNSSGLEAKLRGAVLGV